MRRALALLAIVLLSGCIGGSPGSTETPTATETATPTPTPDEWERATAVSSTIYSGQVGDVTDYFRVEQPGTVTVIVGANRNARVVFAYSAEGEPPTTVTLRGGESYAFDVQPGAYGFEMEAVSGGPVNVRVTIGR